MQHIKANLKDFKEQLRFNIQAENNRLKTYAQRTEKGKIDAFLRNLQNGTEWGGPESLTALARHLQIKINVYQEVIPGVTDADTGLKYKFEPEDQSAKKEISIVYRVGLDPERLKNKTCERNHYDSVIFRG